MLRWILILWIVSNRGVAVEHITFVDQESCEQARIEWIRSSQADMVTGKAFCVPTSNAASRK